MVVLLKSYEKGPELKILLLVFFLEVYFLYSKTGIILEADLQYISAFPAAFAVFGRLSSASACEIRFTFHEIRIRVTGHEPRKTGDEGNRTLISAMRPRRAPVTPRPLIMFLIIFYWMIL